MGLEIEITNSTGGKLDIDALLDPKKILEAPAFPITVKTKPFEGCTGCLAGPWGEEEFFRLGNLWRFPARQHTETRTDVEGFCFREIKRDSTLKVSLLGEAGWMDYPGIKETCQQIHAGRTF
eukprot:g7882.t1